MRHLLFILAATCFLSAPVTAQTLKALMYNTTNGQVVYSSLSSPTFSNGVVFGVGDSIVSIDGMGVYLESNITNTSAALLNFVGDGADRMAQNTRTNLGLGATWLTNTNVTNFRTAIGLGATGSVSFEEVFVLNAIEVANGAPSGITIDADGIQFGATNAATTRANLSLSATNAVTFAGLTNNGDIRINQTAATNGLLYVYRTNNEPFLGLANLIASNNTTVSNETLFRVGVAEATNRSAQFGFRSTNTNGNGVAVFSVFGYNALMQIGADASTNAVIFSGGGTNNEVMTLIKNGATEFARPIAFSTTAHAAATRTNLALGATSDPTFRDVSVRDLSIVGGSGGKIVYPSTNTAPANTTNVAAWIQVNVGTNAYRVPLYQ